MTTKMKSLMESFDQFTSKLKEAFDGPADAWDWDKIEYLQIDVIEDEAPSIRALTGPDEFNPEKQWPVIEKYLVKIVR
tara:strand:- start:166 stop:399 length:234 start_codon:yes stop_codon:yes gene_type:complete